MACILNRSMLAVVITISIFLVLGCSSTTKQDPQQKANEDVARANKSIDEHNKLFEKSRDTYAEVKKKLENGGDPSAQKSQITDAKNTLEEARKHLNDAQAPLKDVRGLDVAPAVKNYVGLLSEAMSTQLDAESKELQFYDILEKDPALKDNREKALNLLSEVGDGYKKADGLYGQAQDLADSKPKVIALPPNKGGASSNAASESTNPSTTEKTTN
jgi:competence protein ComGC